MDDDGDDDDNDDDIVVQEKQREVSPPHHEDRGPNARYHHQHWLESQEEQHEDHPAQHQGDGGHGQREGHPVGEGDSRAVLAQPQLLVAGVEKTETREGIQNLLHQAFTYWNIHRTSPYFIFAVNFEFLLFSDQHINIKLEQEPVSTVKLWTTVFGWCRRAFPTKNQIK